MKKVLILIASLAAVATLITVQVACSNDDDDAVKEEQQASLVLKSDGFVKYGENVGDSAKVSIIEEADSTISISLATGLVGLSFDFEDVDIRMSGDTSIFYGTNNTHETQLLVLKGKLYNDKKTMEFEVFGGDLTDTLYFATDKALLNLNADQCTPDIPSAAWHLYFNAGFSGQASYDGADPVEKQFSSTLDSLGHLTIDLGECQFSAKAPKMSIKLENLCFFNGNNEGEASFSGTAATYTMAGMTGSLPATITGSVSNSDGFQLKIEDITVGSSTHSIVITKAIGITN